MTHNQGQARHDSGKSQQSQTQCGSNTLACTRRDREAHGTPEQPRETRVSRHKHPTSQTSTRSGRNN
ncbi:hypothetical protein Taro_043322 [Colocasia esculenta]|uniref:Uncharacterized protein n=1 Tax=Colocasia esculenta TaxID=4460 RepID=A0A843WKS8_COLES|nr:hypothetical protein [Colocasia esculenta]